MLDVARAQRHVMLECRSRDDGVTRSDCVGQGVFLHIIRRPVSDLRRQWQDQEIHCLDEGSDDFQGLFIPCRLLKLHIGENGYGKFRAIPENPGGIRIPPLNPNQNVGIK